MKCLLSCMWTWVFLVLMGSGRSMGCLEEERNALLMIKAAFNHPNGSSLPSWRDGNGDCCDWELVECDNITLRVTRLYLNETRQGEFGERYRELPRPWVIDASLFLPLGELQVLDLSGNFLSDLKGALHLRKLKRLDLSFNYLQRVPSLYKQTSVEAQNLSSNQLEGVNLEALDLSRNNLVNDALADIARITSLKALNISFCGLNASKLLEGLCGLRNLEELDISGNGFWGPLPSCFSNMTSLRVLDVQYNNLVNDALTNIARITSLKALDISDCGLNASKLLEGLCRLRNLEELVIRTNGFWGPLPSCFCNMTSLRALDVAENSFSGDIPSSLLHNLRALEYIVFSGNAFEGSLSLASLANNSNLKVFHLLDNHNHLEVDTEEPTWFPSFQLKVFSLSNCVLNKNANGVVPSFLKEQFDLRGIQLSHIGMIGNFPNWLLDNNVNLEQFILTGNNLMGAFHLPSNLNLVSMRWFDVSATMIDGGLPSWIGSILPNLHYLNLSNNLLKGKIPPSIGNMERLFTLDLSNNSFTGVIPATLAKDCKSLHLLKLSRNNLQGPMLPRYSNLTRLQFLYLDNNRFTGDISPGILNSSSLQVLDISHNSLSGTLPKWIGDIQHLIGLTLSSNLLRGPLPLSFCNLRYLIHLDLSSNNLGPNIPPCVNVTVMRFLHLTNDMLAGHFPEFLSGASSIVTLDLRHNALSGEVPSWIGSLQNLKVLLLQGNNFEGSIPLDLCQLKNMSILDLSDNNIFGKIPSCLKDLTFGNDGVSTDTFDTSGGWIEIWEPYSYNGKFSLIYSYGEGDESTYTNGLEEVNFMTKSRLESYMGNILELMSGMDLSQNNLTGFIPPEIGYLSELRALNLSYNHLVGPIPETFTNLKSVESLDLSYNNLTGPIPPQLTELYAVSVFRVAHNNLSGRIPNQKNQFGTFDEASYEGNPLLCGPPLTSCDGSNQGQGTRPSFDHINEDESCREAFLWSFAGSYVVAFLGVVLFLYLNSYYRYVLFELVRKLIPSFPDIVF